MTIDTLLASPARRSYAAMPETDALTETDGLQEADLLDAKFSLEGATLALLFDLRVALQFRMANTAVLIMREISQLELTCSHPLLLHRSHTVMSSTPSIDVPFFKFEVGCLDGWRVKATSTSAEFFVGIIPGLPDAPPDFNEEDEATITAGMPAWSSTLKPEWATFIDPISIPDFG